MKKKLLAMLLAVVLTVGLLPTAVFALTATKPNGSGTSSDPFIITSASELAIMGDFPAAHFKLANNITLPSDWETITSEAFTGVLDGGGYMITLPEFSSIECVLFEENRGVIRNLTIHADISRRTDYNTYATGSLFVYNNFGTIESCVALGSISLVNNYYTSGPIVGSFACHNAGIIRNCYARVNISYSHPYGASASWSLGGIAGYNYNYDYSNNTKTDTAEISNCYFVGTIPTDKYRYKAAFSIAYNRMNGEGSISSCFHDKEVVGEYTDSSARSTVAMKMQVTYTGWDFDNVWYIDPSMNDGYPVLRTERRFNIPSAPTAYTITFDPNGGTLSGSTTGTTGKDGTLASLPTPTRSGYTFDGWYTASTGGTKVTTLTVFARNATIYAHWTENTPSVTVAFNPNGGTLSGAATGTNGLPIPTREGYTFVGWFTAAEGGTQIKSASELVQAQVAMVYAHWTEIVQTYTVTFNPNGGALSGSGTMTTGKDGTLSSLPTPARDGYTFDGWYTASTGGTKVTTQIAFAQNTTVYAHWTEIIQTYTVTFNLNGGALSGSGVMTTGKDGTLSSLPTPARDGYTFDGWYTASTGGVKVTTQTAFTQNTAIYAHWTEIIPDTPGFTIKDGVLTAYDGPGGQVTIPGAVTRIGDFAFQNCDNLTSVIIPNTVTRIGSFAFQNCGSLASVVIPDTVTGIGEYAFSGCKSLTAVTIPSGVTAIGSGTFSDCVSLTSAAIPNTVTSIGSFAFSGCKSLTRVTIPSGVTTISDGAFSLCSSLASVTISNGVSTIGTSAFADCKSLTSVTIPASVTSIGSGAFDWCRGLTSVTISNGVTTIGSDAFRSCSGLTSITIPASVTEIGDSAFKWCSGLTSVAISNGVATIDSEAFSGCSALTSITIPASVTTIGEGAFDSCDNLTIHGLSGSFAQTYARLNGIPFVAEGGSAVSSFPDVTAGIWYEDAVVWAAEEGYVAGTGDGMFTPDRPCTNIEILTFLWNAEGKPTAAAAPIPVADWAQGPVNWAYEKGVIDGSFQPYNQCTRATTVYYLWLVFGKERSAASISFPDVDTSASYADAVAWAVGLNIVKGTGNGTYAPNTVCNRAMIATFLHRAYVPEART